jgi:NAD(P)-dependent dehydrogenase (short-subunit alcohol dehydrogenase family)
MRDPAERFTLAGKSAVVTGAAGLLGREHVRALAAAGATVFATDRHGDACAHAVERIRQEMNARVSSFPADITVPESLDRLADHIRERTGQLDVLVNNAALNDRFEGSTVADSHLSRFENYPLEHFRRVLDVNVTGTFLASQILGRIMLERRSGSIINIASTYGLVGPDQRIYRGPDGAQFFWKSPVYPTSKGAVLAFTRFLATTWADSGIRVNSLSPGGMAEPLADGAHVDVDEDVAIQKRHFVDQYSRRTPLGRLGRPDELGGALVFLASDASSYVTGANIVVDGGWTAW